MPRLPAPVQPGTEFCRTLTIFCNQEPKVRERIYLLQLLIINEYAARYAVACQKIKNKRTNIHNDVSNYQNSDYPQTYSNITKWTFSAKSLAKTILTVSFQ